MEVKAPQWFQSSIIYQIFIDRFSGNIAGRNRPDFMGGTIKGVIDHLDYLCNLGINTIWISPFYKTEDYHGYHITNFFEVDEHFGSNEDIARLIAKAHSLGLKIITDFVPNHCSKFHPFFIDATSNSNSKYKNWFFFEKWPEQYLCFMTYKSLPKLNLSNEATYQHILEAALYWLSLGFDGYRLDHAMGPTHKFWKNFYADVKIKYPNSVLIGEVWGQGFSPKLFKTIGIKNKTVRRISGLTQESLQHEYIGVLDAILDFKLQTEICKAVKKGPGFSKNKSILRHVKHHLDKYPDDYLVTFLDNHDMNRFMIECNNDFSLLTEALEFLIKLKRPLVIYYGTEYGMTQKKPFGPEPHTDLLARAPFNWKKYSKRRVDKVRRLLKNN